MENKSLKVNLMFFSLFLTFLSCQNYLENDKIRIGFSQCFDDHPFRSKMNHEMRIRSALYSDVELTIEEARASTEKQADHIKEFIDEGMDVIIVSAVNGDSITAQIDLAMAKGIPVIVLDRKIKGSNFTAFLGADNMEVGKNAAKYILSTSKERANIIEIRGGGLSSADFERSSGFNQIVDANERLNITASSMGDATGIVEEDVYDIFDSIPKNESFWVYAFSDRMAHEAWQVARDLGVERNLRFIGVDGLIGENNGIDLVIKGVLEATLLYPTGGLEAIELAVKAAQGKQIPKMNKLLSTVIDYTNAEIMKNQYDKINEQQAYLEAQIMAIKTQEEKYYAQNNLLKVTMVLLAIILSLTFYSIYSIFAIRKKNRQLELTNNKITIQRNQIEKIAEEVKVSNEAKLNFFTGLSHEFKTPITLILSSIESISEEAREKGSKLMNEMELIYNNSNRLLRLINQLLDFRKIEDRKFNLKVSKTNLLAFSQSIFKDFEREAKKRNIKFKLNSNNEQLDVFIDRNLMDKVYFNLLSNAFKFTPDNGEIEMRIDDDKNCNMVTIHLRDSGIGIPQNEIDQVFQAFFKGSNNRKNSSGIGLHLSKEFVELHKGKIQVKSVHGTDFIITLLKGQAHFDEAEIIREQDWIDTNVIDFNSENLVDENYMIQAPDKDKEKYSVLIIEDNRELSQFLKNKLQLEYAIHLSDGTDAVDKALEIIPDIILCDISLPEKDGFEICEILKKDLRTSHIPTIILTALGGKESYLKGLQSGADLYLTKPFSYSILVQSIKSLLYNREKLRYYYTSNIHKIEEISSFGNIEQKFIEELNTLIKNNLGNSDYSVENLAENLTISRVQLYRKVKAMMGISISDYIANIRLEKAKMMLETGSLTIAEIAYATGFSSPNYFSTSFKNKYGIPPATFRKSI